MDEFCLMLADMVDGTFKDFYLLDRLERLKTNNEDDKENE